MPRNAMSQWHFHDIYFNHLLHNLIIFEKSKKLIALFPAQGLADQARRPLELNAVVDSVVSYSDIISHSIHVQFKLLKYNCTFIYFHLCLHYTIQVDKGYENDHTTVYSGICSENETPNRLFLLSFLLTFLYCYGVIKT